MFDIDKYVISVKIAIVRNIAKRMDMTEERKLYTLEQAAERLSISRRSLERHLDALPDVKKYKFPGDKKFYYSEEDIERVRAKLDSRFGKVERLPRPNLIAA